MHSVFRQSGMRFHFFSNVGDPREPPDIHVERDGREAKFWIGGEIEMAYNHGLDRRDLALALMIVRARKRQLQDAWHAHFH